VDAVFAAMTGFLFDRFGPRTLLVLPFISGAIPLFAYSMDLRVVVVGVVLWGASLGIQESTMRAAVAGMIPMERRATAYGMFSVAVGIGSLIGGFMAGALYTLGIGVLIAYAIAMDVLAFVLLLAALRRTDLTTA